MHIQIQKRDSSLQPLEISKIVYRIDRLIKAIDDSGNKIGKELDIDANSLALDVCQHIKNGIKSTELDEITAEICAYRILENVDYGQLAKRLVISNNHKGNRDYQTLESLTNLLNTGSNLGRYSQDYLELIKKYGKQLDCVIDFTRDYKYFDYFGYKTLEKNYLYRTYADGHMVSERPQHMWIRVALEIHRDSLEEVIKTYHRLSEFYYIHATPTLFNSGSEDNQLSSCFLIAASTNTSGKYGKSKDTVETMYETARRLAHISKNAGGIGLWISDIRGNNAEINRTGGRGSGLVPFLRVLNDESKHIDQGGKRKGSISPYLEPWHPDIFDFLEIKKNTGAEERRTRDLFPALFINDLFMKRVEMAIEQKKSTASVTETVKWSLMCPKKSPGLIEVYGQEFESLYEEYEKQGRYVRQVNVLEVWDAILTSQMETSTPYMLYKDTINQKSNQKNLGTIKSSNLCVSGDTYILTDQGQKTIESLVNQSVNVWNGQEWSNVTVYQTGIDQEMLKVQLSNGVTLKVTPYHKFWLKCDETTTYAQEKEATSRDQVCEYRQVRACELVSGDRLINYKLPILDLSTCFEMKHPYTQGLYYATHLSSSEQPPHLGETASFPILFLNGEKKSLLPFVVRESYLDNLEEDRLEIVLSRDLTFYFTIPMNADRSTCLRWFEGYCDANAILNENNWLEITGTQDTLLKIKLMLQTLGTDALITEDHIQGLFRLGVSPSNLHQLRLLGFSPNRLTFNMTLIDPTVTTEILIVSVEKLENRETTYCFTEKQRGMGMFNGVLTGNCAEIVQYSSYDEIASCNLASLCLPKFVDKSKPYGYDLELLSTVAGELTANLNKVIDQEYYPLPQIQRGNFRHRPIGIGAQGLADVFFKLRLPYDSVEAGRLNLLISEAIYYGCVRSTIELAKHRSEQMRPLVEWPLERRKALVQTIYQLELTRQNLDDFKRMHTELEFSHEKAYETELEEKITNCQKTIDVALEELKIDQKLFNWKELMYWDPSLPPERWGSYSTFEGSPASQGQFHFDLSNHTPEHPGWTYLKEQTALYGWRNSLLVAYMPTASTAQIMSNIECFQPITSNIYSRTVLSGNFLLINEYLQEDLVKLGLWKTDLIDEIKRARGSIQNISKIPTELKQLYKTSGEISKKTYLNMSRDRGYFTDQSQSLNLFIDEPTANVLTSVHLHGWKLGLKTGMYYLKRKTVANAQQFSVEATKIGNSFSAPASENECLMCSA